MVLVTAPPEAEKKTLYSASISQYGPNENHDGRGSGRVQFDGHYQVQMKNRLDKLCGRASFLPASGSNIILVGEIRDFETAEIAIKAA